LANHLHDLVTFAHAPYIAKAMQNIEGLPSAIKAARVVSGG
jgi:hypothetical protein